MHDVNSINIQGKTVALPTAMYTATNPKALKLPIDQRNVAIIANSAAQKNFDNKSYSSQARP